MRLIVIDGNEGDDRRHVPNAPNLDGGAAQTLCGWVDVEHHYAEGAPDCNLCIEIVEYCKGLVLRPRVTRPRVSGTGTKRPFRLLWTNNGILTDELYSAYSTPEKAWAGLGRLLAERKQKRPPTEDNGWWVVSGPDYQEVRGVGREEGKGLPFSGRVW